MHVIGVGPGKAGTTWLYYQLRDHEKISFSKIKETNYFLKDHISYDEYLNYFHKKPCEIKMEISNFYFKDAQYLLNIQNIIPDSKIIFFKRNERDRLMSCFKFELMQGYNKSIDTYLTSINKLEFDNEKILHTIHSIFNEDQVLILDFDDIENQPQRALNKVSEFLSLPKIPIKQDRYNNPSVRSRFTKITVFARTFALILRRVRLFGLLQSLKSSAMIRYLFYTKDRIILSEYQKQRIDEYLSG